MAGDRTQASNIAPSAKNPISTAMPAFWLASAAVTTPTSNGPRNDVTLPESANSPKNWVMRSAGASRTSRVREAACSGPAASPISSPANTIGAFRGRGEQAAARSRRRNRADQRNVVAVDQQDRDRPRRSGS